MNTSGISFALRVRNEKRTLEQSPQSLKDLKIPHEIIVILHLCIDRSKEIVERAGRAPARRDHDSAEAAELRRRLQLVVGMPAADGLYRAVRQGEADLRSFGIELWQ